VLADLAQVWAWLGDVPDPEIPVLSVVDLGIVRDVAWDGAGGATALRVTITPTYSGCPATAVIGRDIARALAEHGIGHVALDVRLAPAWTTDWLSQAGRDKLLAYGIAPPRERAQPAATAIRRTIAADVACPRCESRNVEMTSEFGSTPCKSLYRCIACREPFDHFKCH
jgi:ring-1,2-phenylacetyl-CoA epoxidase subunit PaaD